jgi:hypothetical protein
MSSCSCSPSESTIPICSKLFVFMG